MPVLLFIFLAAALYTDLKGHIIPNRLTVSAFITGMAVQTIAGGWRGASGAFVGAGVGFLFTFVLYLCRAVGAGDVKLFAAVGSLSGVSFVLESLTYAVLIAGGIGAVMLVIRSKWIVSFWTLYFGAVRLFQFHDLSALKNLKSERMTRFPFMLAVFPGVLCAWWG